MHLEILSSNGLLREIKVTVPAEEINKKIEDYIKERAPRVKISGFRPGKVPMDIVKQQLGDEAKSHSLRQCIDQGIKKALKDFEIRQAAQPDVNFDDYSDGKDLTFTVKVETLPNVELKNFDGIELEKLVVDISEKEITETLEKIHADHTAFQEVDEKHVIKNEDRVSCDFTLKINGKPIKKYAKEKIRLDLGEGTFFIKEVEEALLGKKLKDTLTVKATISKDDEDNVIAGKEVEIDLVVTKVEVIKDIPLGEDFAKEAGYETLDALKEAIKSNISKSYDNLARLYMKRHLLDKLEEMFSFDVPQTMVDTEFKAIWDRLLDEVEIAKQKGEFVEDDKSEDEMKEEYKKIATRRVKLGLVISEVSKNEKIKISQEDVRNALIRETMRFPGHEKEIVNFYRSNPQAIERLSAPLLEDKVVDHILTKVKIKDVALNIDAFKEKVKGVIPTMFDDEDEDEEVAA